MMEMQVKTVALNQNGSFSILLADMEEKKVLPIVVGPLEAQAIAIPLQDEKVPRPLTHDLLKTVCQTLEGTVEKIVITDISEGTFFAEIYVLHEGEMLTIDSRPSDAIALALRCNVPIYMAARLVEFTYNYDDIVFKDSGEGEIQ